jgi:hypothetical protein
MDQQSSDGILNYALLKQSILLNCAAFVKYFYCQTGGDSRKRDAPDAAAAGQAGKIFKLAGLQKGLPPYGEQPLVG